MTAEANDPPIEKEMKDILRKYGCREPAVTEESSETATIARDTPHDYPRHPRVEGMVASTTHAGIREFLEVFSDDSNLALLSHIVKTEGETGTRAAVQEALAILGETSSRHVVENLTIGQAEVLAKFSLSDIAGKAAREGARDAVIGSYDAAQEKYAEWLKKHPLIRQYGLPAAALMLTMFGLPLCLSLWRFALYGLS